MLLHGCTGLNFTRSFLCLCQVAAAAAAMTVEVAMEAVVVAVVATGVEGLVATKAGEAGGHRARSRSAHNLRCTTSDPCI